MSFYRALIDVNKLFKKEKKCRKIRLSATSGAGKLPIDTVTMMLAARK